MRRFTLTMVGILGGLVLAIAGCALLQGPVQPQEDAALRQQISDLDQEHTRLVNVLADPRTSDLDRGGARVLLQINEKELALKRAATSQPAAGTNQPDLVDVAFGTAASVGVPGAVLAGFLWTMGKRWKKAFTQTVKGVEAAYPEPQGKPTILITALNVHQDSDVKAMVAKETNKAPA